MAKPPHILIAGGGSLGCIYPGLSLARQLLQRSPRAEITIVGDGRAIERHTVRAAGLRYASTPRGGQRGRLIDLPASLVRDAAGSCVAHWLLRETETDLVISLGGHASGPVVRAARSSGVPYVLLEQNSLPNPATQALAPQATAVCLAFEETGARLPSECPTRWTGGVGRPGFEDTFGQRPGWRPIAKPDDGRPRLLVLGGVAGASSLNESMPEAIARLSEAANGWHIVHQTGDGWLTSTEQRYRRAGVEAVVVSYIDELAHLARASDLVVCRPGGSTLAELALAGLPAVLVPDARRPDDVHSTNARAASLRYGCPVVEEGAGELSADLAAALRGFIAETSQREAISRRMVQDASPTAASVVADTACEALGFHTATPVRLAA